MSIQEFLYYFIRFNIGCHEKVREPVVFPSPGMHQVMDEFESVVFTAPDRDFLHQLGICIHSNGTGDDQVSNSLASEEMRPRSSLQA